MWHAAAKASDIAKGSALSVEVSGKKLALFNLNGKFHALSDLCIHRGGPLGGGHVEEGRVTCPWHAWEFDVKTGSCLTMEGASQKRYAVKVEKGEVFVDL